MKRKVQLYIAGRQVDLGDDSWILYNWTREDMANPTALVNSSSHQVQLPGTARNNSVFGAAFRLDRRTLFGIRYDGTQFDPMRKTPFALYEEDGTVLESGYCRLDEVDTHNRRHAYTVTLYGGLGSFFYALAQHEDGTARTLRDLIWEDSNGADVSNFGIFPGAETVQDAWTYLGGGSPELKAWWNVVNFAPCYNGLPSDFDASHALSNTDAYNNVPAGEWRESDTVHYTYKAGLDCCLLAFENPHTEWELGDLRWYLQRPVVSVKAFIAAVCDSRNNGGYTVTLDPTFFAATNPAYADAWWTLPMIATEDRANSDALNNVLSATKTPMAYLVDYCKHFGLLFLWDSAARTVSIVTRATFYGTGEKVVDLSTRIDRKQQITSQPCLADHRWYQLGKTGPGEFSEQFAATYGYPYGSQRIDTGYEFDAGTAILTDGNVFEDAVEVSESSLLYASAYGIHAWGLEDVLLVPQYERVTAQLWNDVGGSIDVTVIFYDWYSNILPEIVQDNADYPGLDWLPKLQMHGEDGKTVDGKSVLLYFAGVKDTPLVATDVRKPYYLTGDDDAMTDLAGGPCWDLRRTGIQRLSLPSFRRVVLSGRLITESFEWGAPPVRPVPDVEYPAGAPTALYDRWWRAYLSDRYATDTRVIKAMVDLRGLQVGQGLLRRFYWYDNALWVLNAIRNHSLTSWDLTECEFVRVGDKTAYVNGPGSLGAQYLDISPGAQSYQMNSGGDTLTLTVRSSSAWTLSVSGIVPWLSASSASGSAGTTVLTLTVPANASGARRAASVSLTNSDGITRTFTVVQPQKTSGAISIEPAAVTIPATGSTSSATPSDTPVASRRGTAVRVYATGPWRVDYTTVPAWLVVASSTIGVSVYAGANAGAERSANVKIYLTEDDTIYATLSVTQAAGEGGTGDITLTDGNGGNSATVAAAGETLTLYLTIPDGDDWQITNNASFATVSPLTGSGNATITVTVPAYTGSSARQGTIVAVRDGYTEGAVFYLTQQAPAASSDYIDLTRRDNAVYNNTSVTNGIAYEGFDVRASGPWTATTPDSWLHVYMGSWSGNGGNVKTCWFKADANPGAPRVGTIVGTLTGTSLTSTFYVYQAGDGTYVLAASFNKGTIDSTAQTLYLTINATTGVPWSISNVSSGLTPASYSGYGPGEVAVTVAANGGSSARTLSLKVSSASYGLESTASVKQQAPSASSYLNVVPFGTVNVSADTVTQQFSIECPTSWSVSADRVTVTFDQSSGSGNTIINATFPANTGSSAKDTVFTFVTTSGTTITKTVTVRQAAPSSGSISVSPSSVNLSGAGASANVSVTASGAWTATKSASWISVTSSGSAGTSTATISAGRNPGAPRTGTVTFACGGASFTVNVTQGSDADLAVSSNAVTLGSGQGATGSVIVYASGLWDIWEYTDVPVWLNVSMPSHGGSTDGETVTFSSVSANPNATARTATIRFVLNADTSVYQEVVVTQAGGSVLYVSPASINASARDLDSYVSVTSNTDWEITSISEGITIAPEWRSGSGNLTLPFYLSGNPTMLARTLDVVFETTDGTRTATFRIYQEAGSLLTSPVSYTFAGSGEQLPMKVTSSAIWEVYTKPAWITVTPSSGGANTPDGLGIVMEAAANSDTANGRSGSVVFRHAENPGNTWTMLVSQTAGPTTTLTISPTSLTLSDESQYTGTLEVRSSGSWTVTTEKNDPLHPQDEHIPADDIITFSAYSGTGNADLTFTLAANGGTEARTVWVRVRNGSGTIVRTLEIWQPADDGKLTVTPDVSELVFSDDTPSTELNIRSTLGWTLTGPAWLSMSPSSGTAGASVRVTLTATVDPTRVGLGLLRITLSDGTVRSIEVRTVPAFTPVE